MSKKKKKKNKDKVKAAQEQAKKETEKIDKKIEKATENAEKCEEKAKEAAKEGKGFLAKAWGFMKRVWGWVVGKLKAVKNFVVKMWRAIIGLFGKLVSIDSRINKVKKALEAFKENPKAKQKFFKQYKALIEKRNAVEKQLDKVKDEKKEKVLDELEKIENALKEAREKFQEIKRAK